MDLYVDLAGSSDAPWSKAQRVADVTDATVERIEVSVYLKPRSPIEPEIGSTLAERRAAVSAKRADEHADDIRLLTEFATAHGLTVTTIDAAQRRVKLSGSVSNMEAAFQTKLAMFHDGREQFRAHIGPIRIPQRLESVVLAVLGLDTRRAAEPHFVIADDVTSHLPNEFAKLYNFPTFVTGAGQCIAILELGGGYSNTDITQAFQAMGLATPSVVSVSVDGATNAPGGGADREVALDIQVAGGVAPGARQAVYFAPNTYQGFTDAVSDAALDTNNHPSIISISWGTSEDTWAAQARQAMDAALADAAGLGVSVFAASGDALSSDSTDPTVKTVHVDYPASSPWVMGCGGTEIDTVGNSIQGEVVWNRDGTGTGGGISRLYAVPTFQLDAGLPGNFETGVVGRGVPDVAGNASKKSGYKIVLNGTTSAVGGTSAVAPLYAGLTARINEAAPASIGFFLPRLYANPWSLKMITQGNNFLPGTSIGYSARNGWSGCTGLGSPIGDALFSLFASPRPYGVVVWNELGVLFRDANNHISWVVRKWTQDLNSIAGGSPLAKGDPVSVVYQNQLYVMYRDINNNICSIYNDGNWKYIELKQIVPAAVAALGDPSLVVYNDQLHVLYRDINGNISDILNAGGNWSYQNLNMLATLAPLAVGNPVAAVWQNQLHVLYWGKWLYGNPDNNQTPVYLSSIYFDGAWRWIGAVASLGSGTPFLVVYQNTLYWLFRDTNNHISYASYDGSNWKYGDLNVLAGTSGSPPAPTAQGDPFALVYGDQLFVLYRDSNQHISNIYYKGGWRYADVNTFVAGRPAARGNPTGVVYGDQVHILYFTDGNDIGDFYYSNSRWMYQDLTSIE